MSDPVSNAEVEDVLSSIRRLVSEDKRPLQASKPEPRNDRLVLTPALRVADAPAAREAEDDHAGEQSLFDDGPSDRRQPSGTSDPEDLGAAESARSRASNFDDLITDDELLDVYPQVPSRPILDTVDLEAAESETSESDVSDAEEADQEEEEEARFDDLAEDYSSDPYNFDDEDDHDGEGAVRFTHREIEDAPVADAGKPAGKEQEPEGPPAAVTADKTAVRAPVAEPTVTRAAPGETGARGTIPLSAKIEALETAISHIADTWEPDDPGDSDYAGTDAGTMAWEDDEGDAAEDIRPQFVHAAAVFSPRNREPAAAPAADRPETPAPEAEATRPVERAEEPASRMPEPEPQAASQGADADRLDLPEEEQLIDEEALRDLVSEIVRQELQGALGERITRNVRKLVRREIHRALTAQELE